MFKKMAPGAPEVVNPIMNRPQEKTRNGWSINSIHSPLHWRFMALGFTTFVVLMIFKAFAMTFHD